MVGIFLGDRTNEMEGNPLYCLLSGTKYNGQKYVITDTSGIEKLYKSVGCCKMTPVCVIFVTERNWRVQSIAYDVEGTFGV